MVCYAVPTAAALLLGAGKAGGFAKGKHAEWLTLMMGGGALFGVVDHWWNGELFLVGENIMMDLALGFAITAAIFAAWLAVVAVDRAVSAHAAATK